VNRLWASWQLRVVGVNHPRETSFRLDPNYMYGQLIDGIVEVPLLDPPTVNPRPACHGPTSWNSSANNKARKLPAS